MNLAGLGIETYQFVLSCECQNVGEDLRGFFQLDCHDDVADREVDTASPGAGVEFVLWKHFDFRVAVGQAGIEGIHAAIKPGSHRFVAAQQKVLGGCITVGNRCQTVPDRQTETYRKSSDTLT